MQGKVDIILCGVVLFGERYILFNNVATINEGKNQRDYCRAVFYPL